MFLNHIWLLPLLPAFGAVMMFLFGKKLQKPAIDAVCVGAVAVAFVFACFTVVQYTHFAHGTGRPFEKVVSTWLGDGSERLHFTTRDGTLAPLNVDAGFLLDPLSSIWVLFVTGVGLLIHIYATGYMAHEGGYYRFFGYMNLFMFAMLTLVLANNYILMFVGWEGVGLSSYLLIGFYFHRKSATAAANKAFIVNRIGDGAFLLGALTLSWYLGSFRFTAINALARSGHFAVGDSVLTAAAFLLFVGACGKSAQLPLHVWLPDAMEGPTPVSALIHAATMVTAGIYLVARSNAVFVLAPSAMKTVAIVGALTAVFAASIALVQNDIKRVLAYSTISQLGYMFLALGVGAFAAGIFHVFTHAFFKALLFLGSGSVIHALSGEQDMRSMGGLRKRIPVTYWTMLVAALSLAGVFPFAGFFSKDEILWQAWASGGGAYRILWFVGYATALMTAFYMFRLLFLTFYGEPRLGTQLEKHSPEATKSMTVPLVILAFCCIGAGWLSWPQSLGGSARLERFIEPVFSSEAAVLVREGGSSQLAAGQREARPTDRTEYVLMLLSLAAAAVGWGIARRSYARVAKDCVEPIAVSAPPLYRLLYNKYFVDEAYDYVVTGRHKLGPVRLGVLGASATASWVDAGIIDGAVNDVGAVTRAIARLSHWWDRWIIDGIGVNGPPVLARLSSYPARLLEWGFVQWYALVMVAGLLGFGVFYIWK